jgi:hypothetical protein
MSLDDLERIDREFLIPSEVAPILGCSAFNINLQAKYDREHGVSSFPFPVILIGSRVKIPRRAFVEVMKHGTNAYTQQP